MCDDCHRVEGVSQGPTGPAEARGRGATGRSGPRSSSQKPTPASCASKYFLKQTERLERTAARQLR